MEAHAAQSIDSPRAWLTVVATFFSSFVTLGVLYSFGAFFEDMAAEFNSDRASTSVVFAITTFAFFWLGLITGRLGDRFGPRPVLAVGTVAFLVGLLATSRVESLWLGYLTYGVGVGIAAGTAYIPMVAVVGGWFDRHRASAIGLSVAGIGAGTLVLSPLSAWLIDRQGWRDTFVILAIGGTAVLAVCVALISRPPGQTTTPPSRIGEAFASRSFRRLHLSAFCSGLALFVPFVFVGQYAKEGGASGVAAAVLVGVLGGASILARIGFGAAVVRFGAMRLYRGCFVVLASGFVVWLLAAGSYVALTGFVLLLGVGYGGFVALSTIVVAERMGTGGLGSLLGAFYTSQGLGGLIGPPLAGVIIDQANSYTPVILACIALELAAFVLIRPRWLSD